MNKLKIWANLPRVLPHIICYALNKQKRMIINKDIMARPQYRNQLKEKNFLIWELCSTLIDEAEFRNLFYMRIGAPRHLLNILLPKISSMRLSPHIGEGFCPIHSYSTIINGAAKIGNNCTIYHCVTIAVEKTGVPVIGDDVTIGAGAIIMGGIKVGNHVDIGAGAIVIDDVPDHSTVVCPKGRIIPHIKKINLSHASICQHRKDLFFLPYHSTLPA